MRTFAILVFVLSLGALACATDPPVVNVKNPPCECACQFQAVAPEIGRGCWVQKDVLVCPLVKRTLDIEPAYPGDDPRCTKQEDGTIRCAVQN